jgi:hypothetical protein
VSLETLIGQLQPYDPTPLNVCTELVNYRAVLPGPVMIRVPENPDQPWQFVVENSASLCGCGRRRVILPTSPQKVLFGSGRTFRLTITNQVMLLLGLLGGDLSATTVLFMVTQEGLYIHEVPHPSNGFSQFIVRGSPEPFIATWAELQKGLTNSLVMPFASYVGSEAYITGAVTEVSVEQGAVTIQPHAGAAVINPSGKVHHCE